MALDLNSPSVANPYSGTDGGLTFLKLQEDAFKNAEALIVLHRNERELIRKLTIKKVAILKTPMCSKRRRLPLESLMRFS